MKSKKLKKELRGSIEETLKTSFANLQEGVKASRFEKNLKKASKALLAGLKINAPKKEKSPKAKEAAVVAVTPA